MNNLNFYILTTTPKSYWNVSQRLFPCNVNPLTCYTNNLIHCVYIAQTLTCSSGGGAAYMPLAITLYSHVHLVSGRHTWPGLSRSTHMFIWGRGGIHGPGYHALLTCSSGVGAAYMALAITLYSHVHLVSGRHTWPGLSRSTHMFIWCRGGIHGPGCYALLTCSSWAGAAYIVPAITLSGGSSSPSGVLFYSQRLNPRGRGSAGIFSL